LTVSSLPRRSLDVFTLGLVLRGNQRSKRNAHFPTRAGAAADRSPGRGARCRACGWTRKRGGSSASCGLCATPTGWTTPQIGAWPVTTTRR
jgi:hypothetical protein